MRVLALASRQRRALRLLLELPALELRPGELAF